MVQFLSIIFFSWISSIFVGFFKSSRFFVSPCTISDQTDSVDNHEMQVTAYFMFRYYIKYRRKEASVVGISDNDCPISSAPVFFKNNEHH